MKKLLLICLLFVAAAAGAAPAPTLIPFQGRLTDQQGVPYTNGQYTLIYNLYDQAVGGNVLWTETHQKVGVINGTVNVFLGSINAALASVDFSQSRYLGITIDADNNPNTPDPEMVPRQMIIPAIYAKNAGNTFTLAGFDWSAVMTSTNPATASLRADKFPAQGITAQHLALGSVGSAQLANGSVSSSQIAAGAVGSSQLASQAVQTANIADGAVGPTQLAAGAVGFVPRSIQVIRSSGTWVKPAGVSRVYVKVIGRGGNGADANDSRPRGGGGGGGYAEGFLDVSGNVTVTIGAVNSFGTIQATSGSNANGQAGGAGGIGSGGVINLTGGAGQNVANGYVNSPGGMGGASAMGAGGTGGSYQGGSTYTPATSGAGFGGGGGGATWEPQSGAAGDIGAVIVYY